MVNCGPEDVADGDVSSDNGDGTTHETHYWNDGDGLSNRESYNVDKERNVSNLHYTQNDGDGSSYHYDYHNDEWSESHR